MKKILALMLAVAMVFSVAACGVEETTETTTTTPAVEEEVTLVERKTGNVSMLLPSEFEEFKAYEGFQGAAGPGGSVIVAEMMEYTYDSMAITEEEFEATIAQSYENYEIYGFEATDINGVTGMVGLFAGDSLTSDTRNEVCYLFYDTTDGTTDYNNNICFTYLADEDTLLETYLEDILGSLNVLGE